MRKIKNKKAPKVHKGNAIRMVTQNLHIAADKTFPFFMLSFSGEIKHIQEYCTQHL